MSYLQVTDDFVFEGDKIRFNFFVTHGTQLAKSPRSERDCGR
ncbi:hypothetical protein [Burkholderia anthina]|nr:hypothetical protein [Burkholderia anthina]